MINALLGRRYLKEGVVPTTNEITFLRYSEFNHDEKQHSERHPDGQFICYLPAPILKKVSPFGFLIQDFSLFHPPSLSLSLSNICRCPYTMWFSMLSMCMCMVSMSMECPVIGSTD